MQLLHFTKRCREAWVDKRIELRISAGAFLWPAVLLMFLPIQWVVAMLLAGIIHELCHIVTIFILKGKIFRICVGMRGAVIEVASLPPWKELLCALAGPIGSACLLLTARMFPRLAICGVVHCLYNLLPLFPFDGGRILSSLLRLILSHEKAALVCSGTQKLLRIVLALVSVFLALKCGWLFLLLGIALLRGTREEKLLANRPFWRYNRRTNAKGYRYDRTEAENSPQRSEACTLYRRRIS